MVEWGPLKILSSITALRTLAKESQSTVSELWNLTKSLQQSRGHLFMKDRKFCGILTSPVPVSSRPQICRNLNQQPVITAQTLRAAGRRRGRLNSFKSPLPENFHYLTYLMVSWKTPLTSVSLFELIQGLPRKNRRSRQKAFIEKVRASVA